MSQQQDIEIVREAFDAICAGDRDRAIGLADPGVVVDARQRVFNPTTYRGLEGIHRLFADMDDVWADLRPEATEFVEVGCDIVVTGRMVGRGRGSGVEVETSFAGVWTVRDGRIVRWLICSDRAAALEAAGPSK